VGGNIATPLGSRTAPRESGNPWHQQLMGSGSPLRNGRNDEFRVAVG